MSATKESDFSLLHNALEAEDGVGRPAREKHINEDPKWSPREISFKLVEPDFFILEVGTSTPALSSRHFGSTTEETVR